MKSKQKFYICKHCGNLMGMILDGGVPVACCGEKMVELVPNTAEASNEKHLPVLVVEENKVKVSAGSIEHPMTEEHFIQWIYLETEKGGQRKSLNFDSKPEVEFVLTEDKAIAAFAYCNLHGLWRTEV